MNWYIADQRKLYQLISFMSYYSPLLQSTVKTEHMFHRNRITSRAIASSYWPNFPLRRLPLGFRTRADYHDIAGRPRCSLDCSDWVRQAGTKTTKTKGAMPTPCIITKPCQVSWTACIIQNSMQMTTDTTSLTRVVTNVGFSNCRIRPRPFFRNLAKFLSRFGRCQCSCSALGNDRRK